MVLLFGAKKLPEAARSLGQSARVFKGEMKTLRDEEPAGHRPAVADPPQALSSREQSAREQPIQSTESTH
jgi:sec-independent protein translocase protein TatA